MIIMPDDLMSDGSLNFIRGRKIHTAFRCQITWPICVIIHSSLRMLGHKETSISIFSPDRPRRAVVFEFTNVVPKYLYVYKCCDDGDIVIAIVCDLKDFYSCDIGPSIINRER